MTPFKMAVSAKGTLHCCGGVYTILPPAAACPTLLAVCGWYTDSQLHTSYFLTALICEPAFLTYRTTSTNRSHCDLKVYNIGKLYCCTG